MASTFDFELVSPETVLVAGAAEQVILPGAEGDMTILAGHAPVITTLRPGVLEVGLSGTNARLFVKAGFAEVEPDRVTVLVEKVYDMAALDAATIDDEIAAAETELTQATNDNARFLASQAVAVLTRLKGGRAVEPRP
jgi:F-type H+-transporting ATPase subunit epsilon